MSPVLIDVVIWYAGFVDVVLLLTIAVALLAGLLFLASEKSGKRLMRLVRFETARYWVQRMEREGLTLPQKEYREMVKERNPRTAQDFVGLDRIERNRIQAERFKDDE